MLRGDGRRKGVEGGNTATVAGLQRAVQGAGDYRAPPRLWPACRAPLFRAGYGGEKAAAGAGRRRLDSLVAACRLRPKVETRR